jgi:hypothetical protein
LAVGEVGVHDLEQCSKEQSIGRGLVQGEISRCLDVLEIPSRLQLWLAVRLWLR